jgi:RNA polymerase sigma-70 factor (ECF subfamily)
MKGSGHLSNRGGEASPSSSTSLTLLEQVQQGDRPSWERLMKLYRPLVLWWCQGKLARREDAEDVAQEVLTTVLTHISKFKQRQRQGSFRAWLKQITQYKLLEHWKQAGHEPAAAGGSEAQQRGAEVPDAAGAESMADEDASERCILLRSALELVRAEVGPRTLEAAWRLIVDGHRVADVAADLGMTPAAVYTAKSRVLSRLRARLGDLLE